MSFLRRMMLSMTLIAVLVPSALAQQSTQASGEARAAARELIEASATASQFDQMVPLLVRQMTQAFTSLAPDRMVRIYADLMSMEDIREVTKFYQSPAGRRMVEAMPEITRRAASAGQIWGQMLGQEIASEARTELKKRGIEL